MVDPTVAMKMLTAAMGLLTAVLVFFEVRRRKESRRIADIAKDAARQTIIAIHGDGNGTKGAVQLLAQAQENAINRLHQDITGTRSDVTALREEVTDKFGAVTDRLDAVTEHLGKQDEHLAKQDEVLRVHKSVIDEFPCRIHATPVCADRKPARRKVGK